MIDSSGCWQSVAVASASSCKAVTAQNALLIARLVALLALLKPDITAGDTQMFFSPGAPGLFSPAKTTNFYCPSFRVTESVAPVERC